MPKKLTHLLLVIFFSFVFLIPVNEIYARYTRTVRVKIIKPIASQQITVTPTKAKAPTPTTTATPTPTVTPTKTPPLPTKIILTPTSGSGTDQSAVESKTQTSIQSLSTKQEFIMQKINEYRKAQGLGEVKTDSNTCAFAKIRSEEISKSFNHEGFRSRIDSKTLPYSNYSNVTENIAMNSDHTKVVESWTNSPGHAENMRKDTPFVCVENFGNYYAYEGLRL